MVFLYPTWIKEINPNVEVSPSESLQHVAPWFAEKETCVFIREDLLQHLQKMLAVSCCFFLMRQYIPRYFCAESPSLAMFSHSISTVQWLAPFADLRSFEAILAGPMVFFGPCWSEAVVGVLWLSCKKLCMACRTDIQRYLSRSVCRSLEPWTKMPFFNLCFSDSPACAQTLHSHILFVHRLTRTPLQSKTLRLAEKSELFCEGHFSLVSWAISKYVYSWCRAAAMSFFCCPSATQNVRFLERSNRSALVGHRVFKPPSTLCLDGPWD